MNLFCRGDYVLVYDRYRFAIPVGGYVSALAEVNDGVQVRLMTTNNSHYPVGSEIWVGANQLRLTTAAIAEAPGLAGRGDAVEEMLLKADAEIMGLAPKPVKPGDWLASLTSAERKECAVHRGLFGYFPDACALVARHSVRANEKHNPGQPVHWSREKSKDHDDCIARHTVAIAANPDAMDDGQPEVVCRAWRALAALQIWVEGKRARGEKV